MGNTYRGFSDRSEEGTVARATYLKIFIRGVSMTIVLIFAVFLIFWGALWKIPAHNLSGWVIVSGSSLHFAICQLMLIRHRRILMEDLSVRVSFKR